VTATVDAELRAHLPGASPASLRSTKSPVASASRGRRRGGPRPPRQISNVKPLQTAGARVRRHGDSPQPAAEAAGPRHLQFGLPHAG
jgi:hypothetical protein